MDEIPQEKLPDVVLGRDRRFARAEAMALLAASTHPQREAMLAQVLENPDEPREYRIVAAITLGRIDRPDAERVLLRNLDRDHPAIGEMLRSLGRIGTPEALNAIASLALDEKHRGHEAARWAAALISYRLGLPGYELAMPPEAQLLQRPERAVALPIEVRKLERPQAQIVVDALKRYPYGAVELDPDAATLLACRGEINVICFNREFTGPGGLAKLTGRKALVAVGALQSPETGDYSPSYLMLSHPAGAAGGVQLVAPRCSGAFALAGAGRIVGDRAEFELRSVRRPGARSIFVRGTVVDGVIQAAEAVSSTTREPPRIVRRVVVERV